MEPILNAALALAAHGLAVLPVTSQGKEPALKGWQTLATTEPDQVERLFYGRHSINLGVVTGRRSGCFVLDVDCKGVDGKVTLQGLENVHGRLPPTWATETPSGGAHLWFKGPSDRHIGNRVGFAPALDIRGDGGFIVAPPSVVGGQPYRWTVHPDTEVLASSPQWLLELIAPERPIARRMLPTGLSVANGGQRARYLAAALIGEVEKVESAPEGHRNQLLFQAAANLGELVGSGLLRSEMVEASLTIAAEASGLIHDDGVFAVQATIASGMRRGMANPREVMP